MMREALAASVLVLVAIAPSAPALPADCGAALALEESAQNDAESGTDAGDVASAAHRIPHDDYYWGYLSTVDHGAADAADWYVFAVTPGTRSLMANVIVSAPVVPNEQYLPDAAQRFHLTIRAPDGTSVTVSSEGGTATIRDPIPGDHLIVLTTDAYATPTPLCAGEPADLGAPDAPIARNHGLYVGCNPLCAPAPQAALLNLDL